MRIRRLAVALGAVLALGGSVVTAPPSSACLVPCNLNVKAAGSLLGGGIPADSYFFQVTGVFRGVQGFSNVTLYFQSYVGGEGYTSVRVGNQYYTSTVSVQRLPGITGAPSIGLVTISPGPGAHQLQGHLVGQLGGTSSYGHLEITGP
jgi:hypothetical protein